MLLRNRAESAFSLADIQNIISFVAVFFITFLFHTTAARLKINEEFKKNKNETSEENVQQVRLICRIQINDCKFAINLSHLYELWLFFLMIIDLIVCRYLFFVWFHFCRAYDSFLILFFCRWLRWAELLRQSCGKTSFKRSMLEKINLVMSTCRILTVHCGYTVVIW